jgi:hypothetical protein
VRKVTLFWISIITKLEPQYMGTVLSCTNNIYMHSSGLIYRRLESQDVVYEGVYKSFRTGRKWYSSLPLGSVISLFCDSV